MNKSDKLIRKMTEGYDNAPLYWKTKDNPPKLKVKDGAKEVIFELVSAMLDNKHRLGFKNSGDGFKIMTFGFALSNYQIEGSDATDLEWMADEGNWQGIIDAINTGTTKVYAVKAR